MLQIFSDIRLKKLKLTKPRPIAKAITVENSKGKIASVCAQKMNRAEVRRERKKRDKPQPCLWATLIITNISTKHYYFLPEVVHIWRKLSYKHTLKVGILTIVMHSFNYNIKIFSATQVYFATKIKNFLPALDESCPQLIPSKPTGNSILPYPENHNSLS